MGSPWHKNEAQNARLYGWDSENDQWTQIPIDLSTSTLRSISHEHHEIHEGDMYYVAANASLNNNNTISIAITTPNTTEEQHLVLDIRASDNATVTYISGVTSYTGGAAATPYNRNGRSSNTSNCTVKSGYTGSNPLVLTGGTTRFSEIVNASKGLVWDRSSGEEIVLPKNSIEVFRVTAGANGMTITILINWYEHTPNA